jgi:hypothetical protein
MFHVPNTGNREFDQSIILFGFFRFIMKAISSFRSKNNQ